MDDKTSKIIEKLTTSNNALKVYKANVFRKTLGIIVAFTSGILLAVFGALSIIDSNGSFTIETPSTDESIALTLSKTVGFENPTSRISFDSDQELDNISYKDLPEGLDSVDGDHCGKNYLAFTFYVKNVGEEDASITAKLIKTDVVKGSDQAIRVKIYNDGEEKNYAMLGANGEPEFDNAKPFVDDETVYEEIYILKTGEVKKYTIVIWLEGDDPECIDNIKGGYVKLKMDFTGKKIEETNND